MKKTIQFLKKDKDIYNNHPIIILTSFETNNQDKN